MINKNVLKIFLAALVTSVFLSAIACKQPAATVIGDAQTPTDAYKQLYAAVKSKKTEDIKKVVSASSLALAEFQASRSKQPVEQVLANGFTETTLSSNLPQIRDERVKDNFGAVEVWNEKERKWEDLPFIKEEGSWKIAVGDIFSGAYQKPGEGQSDKERLAANTANPNMNVQKFDTTNVNINKNVPQPPMPKKDSGKEAEKK